MVSAAKVFSLLLRLLIPALQGFLHCLNMPDIYVTISGNLTFCNFNCEAMGDYEMDLSSLKVFIYDCHSQSMQVYGGYHNRTSMDKTRGCVTISNAQHKDSGTYFIYCTDEDNRKTHSTVDCHVMAPISITNISKTSRGENSSLTVFFTGDGPATVIWRKIGGELPEGHQLSDSNKTLTIPGPATEVYKVDVFNRASNDSHQYPISSRGTGLTNGRVYYSLIIIIPVLIVIAMALVYLKK